MDRKPDIHGLIGLTSREAERILGEEGTNELPSSKQRGNLRIMLDVMRESMFLLLVACGSIYLMIGDMQEALWRGRHPISCSWTMTLTSAS